MEISEKYANLLERQEKVDFREAQHFRMLHDNFDSDWNPGDEPHGTMIFTDAIESAIPTPIPVDWKVLWLAADTIAKKIAVLAKRLDLE